MSAIVPSQIVNYIDVTFNKSWFNGSELALGAEGAVACVLGLVDLVDRVPQHLITLDREDSADVVTSLAAMRAGLYRAQNAELSERNIYGVPSLKPIGPSADNPVTVLRKAFAKCSDEAPHPKTPDLPFVTDQELKVSLRGDLDQAYRALEAGQWKSATVMAGAVLEALLLWILKPQPWQASVSRAVAKAKLASTPETWQLADYISVAADSQLISNEIRRQCDLCKNFRNLIHPGREIRLGQAATRGRALGSLAAVELVIEALNR
jgi:hypothetical protein